MDDVDFERLSTEILDGHVPDWEALERDTPPDERRRLDALRAVARIAAASREVLANKEPERWGGFELIEPVGHGGYGEVWRAYDPQLDRHIALKLVPAEHDQEAHDVLREGRLLARVRHPNVAAIYGASRVDREIGVAMEFVSGDDLDTRVRRHGPLPSREALNIGLQLARALDAVHRAGVLHRDVKASNVKCTEDGRAILLDFGSSGELRVHSSAPVSEPGTPLYLAPEVLLGGPATIQSDLYSLGVLLYYLATGRYPVRASSIEALRSAHAQREGARGPDPKRLRIPRRLAKILNKLLASNPAHRPRSAADLAAELSRDWRRPAIAAGIAVLAVGGGALGIQFLPRSSRLMSDSGATARRLEFTVPPAGIGRASFNGRVLPFVDRRTGGLALMRLDSGAVDLLTSDSDVVERYAGAAAASPDGRRLAYQWHGDATTNDELKIMDLDKHTATVVWRGSANTEIKPTAWSQDGSTIAGVLEHEDGTQNLFTLTPGAAPNLIDVAGATAPAFSADGRFLVFQKADPATQLSALWILEVPSGTPRRLRIDSNNDRTPVWTGGNLAFVSERGGTAAVWVVGMNAVTGDPEGVPWRVSGTEGVIELLAATDDGSLVCGRGEGSSQVFVSNLDGSAIQRISTGPGAHLSPDWSPDGGRIAYITQPLTGPVRSILRIRDLQTGGEQSFDALGRSFGKPGRIGLNPRFSPDGSRVILRGPGFFVAELNSGKESRQFAERRNYGDVEWDDETHVFFLEFDRGISRLNLATGEEQRLFSVARGASMGRGITVSADKTRIGFVVVDGERFDRSSIMVMNRDGSGVRELLTKTRRPGAVPFFAAVPLLLGEWDPDGAAILFAATDVLPNGFTKWDTDLWSVPGVGGPAQRTGLNVPGLRDVRPEPKGRRIVFTSFTNHLETWLLRGVLGQVNRVR